ncbi:hypothetical protein RHABOEDO_000292 [Candidatus Rhabdochlamydia oedothoracis]|uniref:Sulfotransferase domain-containing protein n=2 Tax=Candidatus Rhabdochlamydia TaxID=292833 RepID=A0ABX8UZX7_9BACT|nr:sulfotransferase domain-containing protein [Candidatus Rhabdochlamydia oedothoracis]KAG6559630.1 hypothetical protein RHOW815_000346 [Candidatus Rhabdochlamydia sp. W815]MCL6756477.1 sulfotransferase domain-containing protein [Candidatus Rhabdochlamydia oedothoracis]QYF48181.1 hypothetical protein RHABOEDO_000292 [Candidatus Rhabdochlamydia oedothoracis]
MVKRILTILIFFSISCYADFSYDLAILTIPKSGTHLLEKSLGLITRQEFKLGQTVLINGKLVLFNHLWPEMNSVIYNQNKFKVILFRDPRDALISQMFWMEKQKTWPGATKNQIDAFLSMPEYEKINFLIDIPVGMFYYFNLCSELLDDSQVIAFRFEDLVGPEGGGCRLRQEETLKKLALILGQAITTNEITEIALQLFGNTKTFRKGQIDIWKQYFSDEHKSLFKKKMGEYLIKLGYEKDNQW